MTKTPEKPKPIDIEVTNPKYKDATMEMVAFALLRLVTHDEKEDDSERSNESGLGQSTGTTNPNR